MFAATINPPVGGYFKDATGSRRLCPVTCNDTIDRVGLERDRNQLWAEAVHRYEVDEKWWLETPELEALATAEQNARFKLDAWQQPIMQWLGDRGDVSVTEVLEHGLGLSREEWTQSAQNRVAKILTHLGFGRCRTRLEGRPNRYRRAPLQQKSSAKDPDHPDQTGEKR